jgi:hypothetical protein
MSVKARHFWMVPVVFVATWLAVRTLAANPAFGLDDPQLATGSHEIADPALAGLISRFAARARGQD